MRLAFDNLIITYLYASLNICIFSVLYRNAIFYAIIDIDETILDGVKEKLLEGFRNEEEFGYMAGYEPWEKLIFDR